MGKPDSLPVLFLIAPVHAAWCGSASAPAGRRGAQYPLLKFGKVTAGAFQLGVFCFSLCFVGSVLFLPCGLPRSSGSSCASFSPLPKTFLPSSCFLHLLCQIFRTCGHNAVKLGILREVVNKGNDDVAIEDQSLSRVGVCHVGKLVRGNVQLLCQNLSVTICLIEHVNKVTVLKDILNLP